MVTPHPFSFLGLLPRAVDPAVLKNKPRLFETHRRGSKYIYFSSLMSLGAFRCCRGVSSSLPFCLSLNKLSIACAQHCAGTVCAPSSTRDQEQEKTRRGRRSRGPRQFPSHCTSARRRRPGSPLLLYFCFNFIWWGRKRGMLGAGNVYIKENKQNKILKAV